MIQSLTAFQIREIVDGQFLTVHQEALIHFIAIDSRNIIQPETTMFVALKGAKFDGHHFIPSVSEEGVRCFLVQKDYSSGEENQAGLVMIGVKNPLQALQSIASYQRNCYNGPLVGITGSNGKTIVKEWLGQILGQKYAVAKSPKSYNSQVGVPLSIFGISPYHQVAVMEAGISRPDEMQRLVKMLRPNLGIFTNIGTAHEEGFTSIEQKLEEKAKLFEDCKLIIYRKEHGQVHQFLQANFDDKRLVAWSDYPGTDYTFSVKKEQERSKILLMKPDLSVFTFSVPFTDEASLENVRHAIAAALVLEMDPANIQLGLDHLKAVDMRLTLKTGANESLIIDDTYNNDLAGLRLAMDFMAAQRPKKRKILIISDLLQIGDIEEVYREVGRLIHFHGIDKVIAVGSEIQILKNDLGDKAEFYADTETLLNNLLTNDFENDLIMVTGARKFGFEAVVNLLQQRIHGTTLEININALTHNYNFYKTKLLPNTKVMVMVKAFAYGGGATEIANHLQQLKADYLAVAYTDEGVALREQGIVLPIMVLNPVQESFFLLERFNLEPVVYSLSFYQQIGRYCKNRGCSMNIHLDMDTGMHRLGFELKHMSELLDMISEYHELKISSVYTHLAGADEEVHKDYSLHQLEMFLLMYDKLTAKLGYFPLRHTLNSAGIIRFPEFQMEMVRLGIGLYGVEVSGKHDAQLKSVSTLKTTISQIKTLDAGETVGYGRKGVMSSDGQIATIAIGYADGYDRRFSNGIGYVLINGIKAPVIGNVCMDMTMIDISGMDAKEGDEVIIYGPGISLKDLANRIGTISYELLTNISSRVKRVYYLD